MLEVSLLRVWRKQVKKTRIRIGKKLSIAFIVMISIIASGLPVFGQGMGVKLSTRTTSETVELGVALDAIPEGIRGIEVHLPTMSEIQIEKTNWANEIKVTDVHIAKVLEDKQTVALYVVSEMDFAKLEDKNLVTLNLRVVGNIEGIKGKDAYIKYVDENAKEVVTTAKVDLIVESNEGGGNNSGGNNNSSDTDKDDNHSNTTKPVGKDKEEVTCITFIDTDNHWASEAIMRMASKGILQGYNDGTFKPNNDISRGEIAAVLSRAFDFESTVNKSIFKDVETGKWYVPYVQAMYEHGITTGMPDGTFGVGKSITNEDFAVMINRILKAKGIVLEVVRAEYVAFKDHVQISDYAQDAIKELYQLGILSGSAGEIKPKELVTRAQVATIIDRVLK